MIQWIKSLFKRDKPDESVYEKILTDVQMRNNPYYEPSCAIQAFHDDCKEAGITPDEFRAWYSKRVQK